MDKTKIKSICMGCVYADDYEEAFAFYNGLLDLNDITPMGDNACYFKIGEQGVYLEGGHKRVTDGKISRTTFIFDFDSVSQMYNKLKKAGVRLVQPEPMKMQEEPLLYWFQCYDPSGNVVEFLGGE